MDFEKVEYAIAKELDYRYLAEIEDVNIFEENSDGWMANAILNNIEADYEYNEDEYVSILFSGEVHMQVTPYEEGLVVTFKNFHVTSEAKMQEEASDGKYFINKDELETELMEFRDDINFGTLTILM